MNSPSSSKRRIDLGMDRRRSASERSSSRSQTAICPSSNTSHSPEPRPTAQINTTPTTHIVTRIAQLASRTPPTTRSPKSWLLPSRFSHPDPDPARSREKEGTLLVLRLASSHIPPTFCFYRISQGALRVFESYVSEFVFLSPSCLLLATKCSGVALHIVLCVINSQNFSVEWKSGTQRQNMAAYGS